MNYRYLLSSLSVLKSKFTIQPNKEIIPYKFEKFCLYFVMKSKISKNNTKSANQKWYLNLQTERKCDFLIKKLSKIKNGGKQFLNYHWENNFVTNVVIIL